MEPNPPTEGATSSSEDGQHSAAFRRLMAKAIQEMLANILPQVIKPIMKECIREVVNEEIPLAIEKYLYAGNRMNPVAVPNERSLRLKFLNEVSRDVTTGKEIKGEGGMPMRVAIVDDATGQVIESGPESCAKVEILFLEASENENDQNWTHEDFVSRIIETSDKTKPHFAKSAYVSLEKGIGELSEAKLANDSNWTKSSTCRLGAQVAENLSGVKVLEGWTKPFVVSDSRKSLYEKHDSLSLSDKVWRLHNIARRGERCRRLKENGILTVQDFLFFRSVNPQRLKEIIGAGATAAWQTIENHLRTCKVDDSSICVYYDSSEHKMSVVFDVVGVLKGVIQDARYVRKDDLSEADKDHAHKLLHSAFENRSQIKKFDNEMTLVQQYPYRDNPIQDNVPACTSSRGISPSIEPILPDYEKHDSPSLKDEVYRLLNICKGDIIDNCLQDNKIHTVEDFLVRLLIDPEGLRWLVSMEQGKWNDTINNAQACRDKKMYCYTDSEKKTAIAFNILGEVVYSNNQFSENHEGEDPGLLLASAYKHWEDVKQFDDDSSLVEHWIGLNKDLDPLYIEDDIQCGNEFTIDDVEGFHEIFLSPFAR